MTPNPQAEQSPVGLPVAVSPVMQRVMQFAAKIAPTDATVLITGESGCGKEVAARAVHERSLRAGKPWIDINCAALPDHLLESELFGFEKGAFSGADTAKPGMFELAHQGTLFLDEIGELSLRSQSKLLRVLDCKPHYRLGGTRKIEVNVRIIAATNADLEALVQEGRFRADLFYRLNQVRLAIPPLRERMEEIPALARLFAAEHKPGLGISDAALAALCSYCWPGNIRELKSLMARLAVTVEGGEIRCRDLPREIQLVPSEDPGAQTHSLNRLQQEVILHALEQASGRRDRAAEMLGISRRTLIRRLKVYGIGHSRNRVCNAIPSPVEFN